MDIVCLITGDFRFSYEMITKFKEFHIPFTVLRRQDPVPLPMRIIVTTEAEAWEFSSEKMVLYPTAGHGPDFIVARIKNYMKNITHIKSVVIGIDPGKRVGIIILVNDILIENHTLEVETLPRFLKRMLLPFEDQDITVRIGAGSTRYLRPVIQALRKVYTQFSLKTEIVDERRTTRGHDSFSKFRLTPHEIAALHIAIREGESIDIIKFPQDATGFSKGEISFVQERSRRASDGRITISRMLAQRVLAGDLSLHKALELQLQKRNER